MTASVFTPERTLLALTGADAADFLNRLFTLDCHALAVGTASRAFHLDARGKIVLALRLLRVAEDTFWTDVDPDEADAVRARLDMFHFGEKFAISTVTQHRLVCWFADAPPTGEGLSVRSDRFGPCFDVYAPIDEPPTGIAVDAAWCEQRRIEHGAPAWPFEYRTDATPLDVGLAGVTEGKGCYPGQEVIERTLALGRPARRLVRVRLNAPVEPGPLTVGDKPVGVLTSVTGTQGLALIKFKQTGPFQRDAVSVSVVEDS
jgi:folate-binding protein YgfZ